MRKVLLVVFVGMVLAMSVYGVVNQYADDVVKDVDRVNGAAIEVYVE